MPLTKDLSDGCKKTDGPTGRPLYPIPAAVRVRRQFPFLLRGLPRRRVVVLTEQIGGCAAICGLRRRAEARRCFGAFLLRIPGPQREEVPGGDIFSTAVRQGLQDDRGMNFLN